MYCSPEPNHDQTANTGSRSGNDEGVSKAKFVDRDAETDHHNAHGSDDGP